MKSTLNNKARNVNVRDLHLATPLDILEAENIPTNN